MKNILIEKNDSDQRVDKFLTKSFSNFPVSMIYKYIRKKDIKINGKRCSPDTRLNVGDILTLYVKDEFLENSNKPFDFLKAPKTLDIVFEDENIIIVNKKPGLIVHPDENCCFDSLITRIQHYLYSLGQYNPQDEHSFAPALVNRIDLNTSGLVMAAKNATTLRILNEKMKNREIEKIYLCIVHGRLSQKSATLEAYLEKNEQKNMVFIHKLPRKGAKIISTRYRVLCERANLSLLEVELLTGRTHQIRAHMAWLGHPLLGDGKYGSNLQNKAFGHKHQALYSYKLRFNFDGLPCELSYLNGREFSASLDHFLKNFCIPLGFTL